MNTAQLEAFLAKLYTDEATRTAFLADPRGVAQQAGLAEAAIAALLKLDRVGLELTARSLARKRAQRNSHHDSSTSQN